MDLFNQNSSDHSPLAFRMRPKTLDDFVGQNHLVGDEKLINQLMHSRHLPSLILWGPPGSGKTTLAHILSQTKSYEIILLSAVTAGTKDVKESVKKADDNLKLYNKKTILFLDEIHRFNKAQQDSLLPHVESGLITLIGATTENPSFEVISALLSRTRVLTLEALSSENLENILNRALSDKENGLGDESVSIDRDAINFLCQASQGDARRMLNTLEVASWLARIENKEKLQIKVSTIEEAFQTNAINYDKKGEEHYNIISAFIKSMRDSDADATLYYLARMLEGGEDPLFILRRMVIFASEDIGNADPQAIQVAVATQQSFHFVGMPEGWIPLAQCATYLANAPKSNASYKAYKKARIDVKEFGPLPVPLHLRNAPTDLMKDLGYGKGYKYAHDEKDGVANQEHLPEKLKGRKYFETN